MQGAHDKGSGSHMASIREHYRYGGASLCRRNCSCGFMGWPQDRNQLSSRFYSTGEEGKAMTETKIEYPHDLMALLAVMKSAKEKGFNMNVWDRDIKAVENAIATIMSIYNACSVEEVLHGNGH
jgi:hypothetical protein